MDMEKSAAEESYGPNTGRVPRSSAWVLTSLSAQEERAGDFVMSCEGRPPYEGQRLVSYYLPRRLRQCRPEHAEPVRRTLSIKTAFCV